MTFEMIQAPLYITILVSAFAGSWHCGMMCGPVAVAIHRNGGLWYYHLGRGIGYIGLGALFGALGSQLIHFQSLPLQMTASILMSAVIVYQFFGATRIRANCLSGKMARFVRHPLWIGLLTPLIPCGWLWIFFSAAAASGSTVGGMLVLGLLWLSGIPALSVFAIYFRRGFQVGSPQQKKWLGFGVAVAALWALWGRLLIVVYFV